MKEHINGPWGHNQPNPEREKFYTIHDPISSTNKWRIEKINWHRLKETYNISSNETCGPYMDSVATNH